MNRNCRNSYAFIALAGMVFAQGMPPAYAVGRFTDRFAGDTLVEEIDQLESYEVQISPAQDDYAKLCDEIPTEPLSRWRILLNRFGSALVVRFAAIRSFFSSRYQRLKTWLHVHAWQRIRRERAAQQA
jgi:hypothetical protein